MRRVRIRGNNQTKTTALYGLSTTPFFVSTKVTGHTGNCVTRFFLFTGEVDMPEPNDGETQDEFMSRCIPMEMHDNPGMENDQAVAICASKWEKKSITIEPLSDAVKIGARNSAKDAERLQKIHDLAAENGAVCAPAAAPEVQELPFMSLPDDALVAYGGELKAIGTRDGKVEVGGYLVRFTTEDDPDLTEDFFHKDTDFGVTFPATTKTWFNHCLPVKGRQITREFPPAELTRDETGIFLKDLLDERDEYEALVIEMSRAGKMGLSSGTAGHLVKRTPTARANRIDRWILGLDASFTHTPAESRNALVPLKSLIDQAGGGPQPGRKELPTPEVLPVSEPQKGIKKMEMTDADIKQLISDTAKEVLGKLESEPAVKRAGVAVVDDEADRALKGNPFTFGSFHQAVANSALYGTMDKRLLPLKAASGMNETIPSQGGYLLQPQFAAGIVNKLYPAGNILNKVRWIDLDDNKNELVVNMIDETSRADGSRLGGLQGYWLAEAASKTASKPKLRQVSIKAHKVAALVYATDELLQDATALESYLGQEVPNELRFKVEAAIYGGDGVGKPLGWIESPSRKIIARDTASKVLAVDVKQMWTALWPSCRKTAEWYCGPDTESQIFALYEQTGIPFPFVRFSDDGVLSLFGRPVNVVEYSATLNTAGDFILVDPTQYMGVRKGGVQAASSIHVLFTTDESAFRYVMRSGGEDSWHSTITAYGGSATLSDIVMLGSATATTT